MQDIFVLLFHISPPEGSKLESNGSDTRLADLSLFDKIWIICKW